MDLNTKLYIVAAVMLVVSVVLNRLDAYDIIELPEFLEMPLRVLPFLITLVAAGAWAVESGVFKAHT